MIEYRYYFDEKSLKTKLKVERSRIFRSVLLSLIIIFFLKLLLQSFWPFFASNYVYILGIIPLGTIFFNYNLISKKASEKNLNEWHRGSIQDDGTFTYEDLTKTLTIPFAEISCFYDTDDILIVQGTRETHSLRFYFFRHGFQTQEQFDAIKNILKTGIAGHKGLSEQPNYLQLIRKYLSGF